MAEKSGGSCEFGAFRFDLGERVLYRGPETVPLTPKVADTLAVLLANRGRVVEKGELLKAVWPDTFVEEGGLARNISVLRKALGDEPEGSRYIETIPKRGYRFVAAVNEAQAQPRAAPAPRRSRVTVAILAGLALLLAAISYFELWHKPRATGFRANAIAVLPLKNLSSDPAQQYFSEGMTDTLATELAKTGVRVIAPDSVRRLRAGAPLDEVGRQLKVDAVVQGTVLNGGGRVRINVQVVDVRTGALVWAESYQRAEPDVLALQAEVAAGVAREVVSNVSGLRAAGARPVIPEAYRAYLKGRFFWNKRTEAGLRKAVEYFNEAIGKDATYPPAHAGLADSYALLASSGYDAMPPSEAMPRARAAAVEALKLDPRLAEAHTSLAYVRMAYDWDLPAAQKEFQEAFRLNPGYATAHHWYAHFLLAAGQVDKAAAQMREALALDPLSLPVNVGVGWCSYFGRHYDEAVAQYRKALELDPEFALAHQTLAMALEQKHAYTEAIAEFQRAVDLSGASASTIASLGHAYAVAGRQAEAHAQLDRLQAMARSRYVPAMYLTLVYAGLGDNDRAAQWFAKAREERCEYLIYGALDPQADSFRSDPRFALPFTRVSKL